MTEPTDLDAYCRDNAGRFLDELIEVLRIPSISAQPDHAADVRRSAEHIAAAALKVGFTHAEVLDTEGHPAVYAERIVDPSLPTVLIYGHHDVQPVDPLDEWTSPPFEPEVRSGRLHARGAVDDKGQVWMHLKAVEAHLRTRGELPLNAKLIVEGEEEVGSVHFGALLERERERLACDVCIVSDTEMPSKGQPAITVGLRGLVGLEVEVSGPEHDLHSGAFGGAVANPAEVLARIVASLKDHRTERVLVPGFYDDVVELSPSDRAAMTRGDDSDEQFLREASGAPAVVGEDGYTTRERIGIRPTLEINGIWGGYQGAGSKTIVPARATAKITCRLVPNQDPETIIGKVKAALLAGAPATVRVRVTAHPGAGQPVVVATDHPAIRAAAGVLRDVFGRDPVFLREGGSIPPVEMFARVLGVTTVMLGVGLPDDNYHAPNESFDIEQFDRGTVAVARLWDALAVALLEGQPAGR
jgi:acetylornithine deacetylase/succinyl-diaminopimelate desuccinylase-like protein